MPLAPNMAPAGTVDTPAMQGKRHRADELGERVIIARNWRYLAFALVVLHLCALGLIGWLAGQPRLVPVYIEVETASGYMQVVRPGADGYTLTDATVERALREFIQVLRGVSPAKHLMQTQWKEVFFRVTPRAYPTLKQYAQDLDPLMLPGERRIQISHVLKQSPQTAHLRWEEATYTDQGVFKEKVAYSGVVTWVRRAPTAQVSLEELRANPPGIYIDTWHWSKE